MLAQATTARGLINAGALLFDRSGLVFGHGTDNPFDEAVFLVLHALALDFGVSDAVLDAELAPQQIEQVKQLLEQRVSSRKPAAYLTGEAWFAGMSFLVNEHVLVPRSPLAELIENQFQPWIRPDRIHRVLDLCTGSGCIGIACAQHLPGVDVTLTDISPAALQVADANIERHGLGERVRALQSDVYSALAGRRFDIIVSNPPYVPAEDMTELAEEFLHEPALGLVGGADGLDIVVRILQGARAHLEPGGLLIVEVGHTRDLLIDRFPEVAFLWLEFEFGGEGVMLLDYDQLTRYEPLFAAAAAARVAPLPGTQETAT